MEELLNHPHKLLHEQRVELITGRCYFVMEKHGLSHKKTRSYVRSMAKWLWEQETVQKNPKDKSDFSLPYTRPVSSTIWDESFNLSTSIANQSVTKQFLTMIGSQQQLSDHRFYGYVTALALLEIMQGLLGTRREKLRTFENFGGPHEEGGTDWTALEFEEELATMVENMIGKAEEFVFKADEFEEAARAGLAGSTPTDCRWEPPVLEYLKSNRSIVEGFRKSSGKINKNGLANHLITELQTKQGNADKQEEKGERYFYLPSDRTIVNRLSKLLLEVNILETRG